MRSIETNTPFIAVSINYRLNLFGFAGSHELIAAQRGSTLRGSNFGLRDQRVALEWVSQNIAAFGGNPERITIGGQSAGGISVHIHALEAKLSPKKPLFKRAIIQSGAIGTLGPTSLKIVGKRLDKLCQVMGLEDDDVSTKFGKLKKAAANQT